MPVSRVPYLTAPQTIIVIPFLSPVTLGAVPSKQLNSEQRAFIARSELPDTLQFVSLSLEWTKNT